LQESETLSLITLLEQLGIDSSVLNTQNFSKWFPMFQDKSLDSKDKAVDITIDFHSKAQHEEADSDM